MYLFSLTGGDALLDGGFYLSRGAAPNGPDGCAVGGIEQRRFQQASAVFGTSPLAHS